MYSYCCAGGLFHLFQLTSTSRTTVSVLGKKSPNHQCLGETVLAVCVAIVHLCLYLNVSYFVRVRYQNNCQELFLHILPWSKVVYKAYVLYNWDVILGDDALGILEYLKILLVCFKFSLPALEHWYIGFPHCVGKLLFSIELKHASLDKIQHFNKVLVMINGFIFTISPNLGKGGMFEFDGNK